MVNESITRDMQYTAVLPEKSEMPYFHLAFCDSIKERIDAIKNDFDMPKGFSQKKVTIPLVLDKDEAEMVETALTVYKAALLAVHDSVSHAPVKTVMWEKDYEDENGEGYPICPECREFAYGLGDTDENGVGQCPFCGQRYHLDEDGKKKMEPNPEETITCPKCHQETMVGRRAKSNGHFHGRCTNCGCLIIE